MTRENNLDNNQTILYTYDKSGNILSKKIYTYTVGTVSGTPETITYSYGNSSWKDLLTAYNGETITYDAIGNPLNYRDGMTFQWSGGRKLTSFSTPNAVGSYIYNSDGIRVYKEVNGNTTEYYLNGTQIETEITNFGGVTRRVDYIYDENGSIYGFVVDNTAKYYYTKNLQGDVIGILDSAGTTIVEYSYDAWGKATVSYPNTDNLTDAEKQARYLLGSNNPFRYRGYYFDNETGFYYLNSRYYDPETGRFINGDAQLNTDSILGLNVFAYCYNDPILLVDSTGNRPVIGAHPQKETKKAKEAILAYMRKVAAEATQRVKELVETIKKEKNAFAAIVYAESGGENQKTQKAVAHSIQNRVKLNHWTNPKTITDVITYPAQYSAYNNNRYKAAIEFYTNGKITSEELQHLNTTEEINSMQSCMDAVIPIYSGRESDFTGGVMYFHSFENPEDWAFHDSSKQVYIPGTSGFWWYR